MRTTSALAFTVAIGLVACGKDPSASAGSATSSPVGLPDLAVSVDEIDKVSITNADKGEVVLEKKTATWEVAKPVQAPANQDNVKQLLDNMKELKLKEVISSAPSPEQKKEYQFEPDKAVHVVVSKGADKKLDVSFGKSSARGQTAMVDGKPAIYTVSGYSSSAYARDPQSWSSTGTEADARDTECADWVTICTLGRHRDGSERTTGLQHFKTKALCENAGPSLGVTLRCDPCHCFR